MVDTANINRAPDEHKKPTYGRDLTVYAAVFFDFYYQCTTLGGIMIGVILWSDMAENKAVIWCEDHGDLAFLSAAESVVLPDPFFEVGDVVKFDVKTTRNLRLATNPERTEQSWGPALSDNLRSLSAISSEMAQTSAKVIPFRPSDASQHATRMLRAQKRHG